MPGYRFKWGPSVVDPETGMRHSKGEDWLHPLVQGSSIWGPPFPDHHKIWPKKLSFTWGETVKKHLFLYLRKSYPVFLQFHPTGTQWHLSACSPSWSQAHVRSSLIVGWLSLQEQPGLSPASQWGDSASGERGMGVPSNLMIKCIRCSVRRKVLPFSEVTLRRGKVKKSFGKK